MPLTKIAESDSVVLLWQIDRPRIRVWRCLTQPDLIRQWLGHLVSGQVRDRSDFAIDHRHRTLDLRVLLKRLAEPQSVAERVRDHDGWAAGEGWVNVRAELGVWA